MLDEEPQLPALPAPAQADSEPAALQPHAAAAPEAFSSQHEAQRYTEAALESIRQRLEELMQAE